MAKCFKRDRALGAFQWLGEEVAGYDRICVCGSELATNRYNLVVELPANHLFTGQTAAPVDVLYVREGDWIITENGKPVDVVPPQLLEQVYIVLTDEGEQHWPHSPKQSKRNRS